MAVAHLSESEYEEIEDRKKREHPTPTIQHDHEIGPQREDPHEHDNPRQYKEPIGPTRDDDPHKNVDAHAYSEPAGPKRPSKLQQHLTDGANRFLFGTTAKTHAVNAAGILNHGNEHLRKNTSSSPAAQAPAVFSYGQKAFSPFVSPYARAPAPARQTKKQRREDRRQQRTGTTVPAWVFGQGPAPWMNQKTTTKKTKKTRKQSAQPRSALPAWMLPPKPSWIKF
jgi:hypothetical protein